MVPYTILILPIQSWVVTKLGETDGSILKLFPKSSNQCGGDSNQTCTKSSNQNQYCMESISIPVATPVFYPQNT